MVDGRGACHCRVIQFYRILATDDEISFKNPILELPNTDVNDEVKVRRNQNCLGAALHYFQINNKSPVKQ